MSENLAVVLRRSVQAQPVADDFELVSQALPAPAAGELLVRSVYLSLDP
jgi:NADPH-dependent curcumin reductase CurA